MSGRVTELDRIIQRSLSDFVDAITRDRWSGRREREAISLYVMAHLQHEAKRGRVLYDPLQIAIEFPIRQIAAEKQTAISRRKGAKREVAKDVMIWREPKMTTWTRDGRSHHAPLAILEWKFGRVSPFEDDVRWLEEYAIEHPGCVGYAVSLHRDKRGIFSVNVARVARGKREAGWFAHAARPALTAETR